MKKSNVRATKPATSDNAPSTPSELPTFLEHIYELRKRLFWVVAVVLVASAAAYPFLDSIIGVLTAPLGKQQLYYLTPIGGLSFSIKICLYIGIMVAVPFLMYHIYRFLEPIMGQWRKSALFYVGFSSAFAICGVLFAYFVSLPGALHFLTGLNLTNIQAMLTVDSYLSFVMTYLLGAALLFQIPLLLLIINNMTPLKPSKLMKAQRFVVVGAFIIAAIISPTPDILNQILFALPIIAMYQLGVVLVWLQNRARQRKQARAQVVPSLEMTAKSTPVATAVPALQSVLSVPSPSVVVQPMPKIVSPPIKPATTTQSRSVDGFARVTTPVAPKPHVQKPQYIDVIPTSPSPVRPAVQSRSRPVTPMPRRQIQVPQRSVDGFISYRPSSLASSS